MMPLMLVLAVTLPVLEISTLIIVEELVGSWIYGLLENPCAETIKLSRSIDRAAGSMRGMLVLIEPNRYSGVGLKG